MHGSRVKKIDYLFITNDCDECSDIEAECPMDLFRTDGARGECGQAFALVHTSTNEAARAVLDHFGLHEHFIPAMLLHDGRILSDYDAIKSYLTSQSAAQ